MYPSEYNTKVKQHDSPIREVEQSDARIIHQLAFMGDQLSKTRALLEELTEALTPVLIPNEEMAVEEGYAMDSVPRKLASELSNVIDDHNSQLSLIQSRINNITRRLQL